MRHLITTFSEWSNLFLNCICSKYYIFIYAGLQNSTIIIKNVNQQDEGCYNCLFNIQHQGAIICKTCLQIYGKNLPASLNLLFP
uniref:Immunoglobulin V-set domain-containing protein n=1 Tax=Sphaeramia orbicularis TaxID=375764 RepID=A0A672YL81_9TELE